MKVEISMGDFVDRMTILLIKKEKGLAVDRELEDYTTQSPSDSFFTSFINILKAVNLQIWMLETQSRQPRQQEDQWVKQRDLSVKLNDLRYEVKRRADEFYQSEITEKKNHNV